MTISPGTGGTIGGPPSPTALEIEMTASNEAAKMYLGIIPDTLVRPFSDIDKPTTWKYTSTASNPRLASPLHQMRIATSGKKTEDQNWLDRYEHLLDLLPKELREELDLEAKLAADEKDPAFEALQNTLKMTAKGLTWGSMVSQIDPASDLGDANVIHSQFPFRIYESMKQTGAEVVVGAKAYLNQIGHREPQFDLLSNYTAQIDEILTSEDE